jgi:2-oxoglutarate dehydrogenase E1 component
MTGWDEFQGVNRAYLLDLYERYRQAPTSVDDEIRAFFSRGEPSHGAFLAPAPAPSGADLRAVVGAVSLVESIRRYGHLAARIDPLGTDPSGIPPSSWRHTASPKTICVACPRQ